MTFSLSASPVSPMQDERESLGHHRWLFFAFGLISILIGLLAISSSFLVTQVSVVFFGALLLIAGITEVIHAVMVHNLKGFGLHLLTAALYLVAGLFILEDPIQAAVVLTLLIAAYFLVGGLLRILVSFVVQFYSWQWVVLNGVVDLILGVMILNRWPGSSLWVIGLFVGIDLIFQGWSWVILALGLRTYSAPKSA
jgi:uncharacterized membrane protein HdeD (DUF308 family)